MTELTEIMRRRNPSGPVHGWSGSNTYVIRPGPASSDPVNNGQFNVQANFPTVTYYTVQFTLRPDELINDGNDFFSPRGLAEIHWTVQGNHHQRILHVANGTTISGAGEAVWVNFVDASTKDEDKDFTLTVTAIISIVTGTRANAAGSQPPMLVEDSVTDSLGVPVALPVSIATGDFIDVVIPRDCGINSMYISAHSTAIPGVELLGADVIITGLRGIIGWGAEQLNKWVPVPPGENGFRLNNDSGDTVVVGILWGVEG